MKTFASIPGFLAGAVALFGLTQNMACDSPRECGEGGRVCLEDGAAGSSGSTGRAPTVVPSGTPGDLPPPDMAPADSPVALHGALQVVDGELRDAAGEPVQLEGVSSMWLNWENDGYAESAAALEWMRQNWQIEVIRAAMGVDASGAYLQSPAKAERQVRTIVENAIDLGLYVIIDWHDHEALDHQPEAEAFFAAMARDYGAYPNVLYEPFNEPLKVDWSGALKPYHEAVLAQIRSADPDNVVILGTPNWSQDVDKAARDPVEGTNLMYTLHFYACTHTAWLRSRADGALAAGLPLFVTEWGATHADGGLDGIVCEPEAELWHDWMAEKNVSWTAWKLDGCTDSSCLLKQGTPVAGGWTDEWLNGHGAFVRDQLAN